MVTDSSRQQPVAQGAPARTEEGAADVLAWTSETAAQRAAALRELLRGRGGERHIVAIQDFPDPDAISSALAYREMALAFDIRADVVHEGVISHPENLALVNLLDIEVLRFTEEVRLDRYDAAIFVDNQGATTRLTPRLQTAGVQTLVIIDHHEPHDLLDSVFTDIRELGAAATMMTQYLQTGALLPLDRSKPRHVQLATALMHGLHSETERFLRAGQEEYDAAAYLSRFAETELLQQVLGVQKSHGTMNTIQMALSRRTLRAGFALAGVGYIRPADRDAIPQAADFLLTEENVHTAIVYGLVAAEEGREIVSGSLRTNNATLAVDAFLKRALGADVRGRAYGGGRSRAGGFEIDIGFLGGGTDSREQLDMKWTLFDRQIRRKMFVAAGLEDELPEERPLLPED